VPKGFTFSKSDTFKPFKGFDAREKTYVVSRDESLGLMGYSEEQLQVKLAYSLPFDEELIADVKVDNPSEAPVKNLWKVSILDGANVPIYTNDGDWQSFTLFGIFLQSEPKRTQIASIDAVKDVPSESNTIRLRMFLASPLRGRFLAVRVTAPEGYVFPKNCLPTNPHAVPHLHGFQGMSHVDTHTPSGNLGSYAGLIKKGLVAPGLLGATEAPKINTRSAWWVTSCEAERAKTNQALLRVALDLEKATEYSTNLLITNADKSRRSVKWILQTYRNNDLLSFVHYSAVNAFDLMELNATIMPEVKRYSSSSFIHVQLRPLNDLRAFGQIIIQAPDGYTLFCRQSPFFLKGNLPDSVQCNGANTFAVIRLSGGNDFLEANSDYRFAVRVTNPSMAEFSRFHGTGAGAQDWPPPWTIRLQTRERQLIHQSTQVAGYLPTPNSITRFSVAAENLEGGADSLIRVQFKLETTLLRWRTNSLRLTAPSYYKFKCEDEQLQATFVKPATAILAAGLEGFKDLAPLLEKPPAAGSEAYRNEGTTESNRPIVDCSTPGSITLAVDFTDSPTLRYAFGVQVINPAATPNWENVWILESISAGQQLEMGVCGGYDIVPATSPSGGGTIEPPASAAPGVTSARAVVAFLLPLVALI
jgi:hypothetical protein